MADNTNMWTAEASRITDPELLARFAQVLQHEAPLIVEHKFYRGSRGPRWFVADDYMELVKYLETEGSPGDKFTIWHFGKCCRDDNTFATAKYPDADGKVPLGGPY